MKRLSANTKENIGLTIISLQVVASIIFIFSFTHI